MRLTKTLWGKRKRYRISPALCVSEPSKRPAWSQSEVVKSCLPARPWLHAHRSSHGAAVSSGREGADSGSPAQDSRASSLASTALGRRPRLACLLEPPLGEEGSREPSKEEAGNSQWPRQVVRKAGSRSLSKLLHLWRAKIHLWKACQAQARTRCKTNTIPGRLAKLRLTLSFVQQTDENA